MRPATDAGWTLWEWRSDFRVPAGREAELSRLVAEGVYEARFEGLRALLRRRGGVRDMSVVSAGGHRGPLPGRARWTVRANARGSPGRRGTGASLSAEAVVIRRHGGPEELDLAPVDVPPPGPGEVRLRQTAIGVNFLDSHARTGRVPLLDPPGVPGMEAAGDAEYLLRRVHRVRRGEVVLVHAAAGATGLLLCWARQLGADVEVRRTTGSIVLVP